MKNLYLVILVLIAVISSLWAEPVRSDDKPVSFFGIEMGEYIPRDTVEVIKVPEGFDGCAVTVSPLTRRVTAVTLTKKLGSEGKATQWVDTLVSGLALAANAELVYDQHVYRFTKGRLSVVVAQIGSDAYLRVSDAPNDDIHSIIEDARGWRGAPTGLPAEKPAEKPVPTPAAK